MFLRAFVKLCECVKITRMKKLKKILQLSDPYPNFWYEISCYLKSAFGLIAIILGVFFLLSPLLKRGLIILGFALILKPVGEAILAWEEKTFAQNFIAFSLILGTLLIILGLLLLWQIKLVKKLIKTLV